MKLDGFATLYMDKILRLPPLYQSTADEDRIVGLYPHCTFNLNPRAPSIDTPLHGLLPQAHVDHMHPDAVIAIAASKDSARLTQEIWGGEIGWLPWMRPGFELALKLRAFSAANPKAKGVLLEAHGLFTWGDTSRSCYQTTIATINRATLWLAQRNAARAWPRQAVRCALPAGKRRAIAAALMPGIRGMIASQQPKLGHFDDSAAVLQFVGSEALGGSRHSAPRVRIISCAPRSGRWCSTSSPSARR